MTDSGYFIAFEGGDGAGKSTQVRHLVAALEAAGLTDRAHVVVERSARTPAATWPEGFELDLTRDYGETRVEIAVWQDDRA